MLIVCPRCKTRTGLTRMDSDIVHQCSSGAPALDQIDVLNLPNNGWNNLGTVNLINYTQGQIIDKTHVDKPTPRGFNSQTHTQEQHFEYIKVK